MKFAIILLAVVSSYSADLPESNCGPIPCTNFELVDQLVDVSPSSGHAFIAPKSTDIRGPCPGLNAAANHGFINRNGIVNFAQSITGLTQAFNMDSEFTTILSTLAVAMSGDLTTLTWSIGGPYYPGFLSSLLGSNPHGISYSHNNYEGDSSATRADAYLTGGDAHSLNMTKFLHLYNLKDDAGRYYMSTIRDHGEWNRQQSISTNPYYFSAPVSGLFAAPGAHAFIINLFSNHSAEEPNGYLDTVNLKSFFGVTGSEGNFVWNKGQERIPNNWYRRPSTNPYGLLSTTADILVNIGLHPDAARVGGNTGTVNSFTGVDLSDLTNGTFDAVTLLQGNNLACFVLQFLQVGIPTALAGVLSDVTSVVNWVLAQLSPIIGRLACPQLEAFESGLFAPFPGAAYNPVGTAQNFKA